MKTLATVVLVSAVLVVFTMVTRPTPSTPQLSAPSALSMRHAHDRHPAVPDVLKVSKKKFLESMPLNRYPPVVYRFEGMATCDAAPCPNAQVSVRLVTGTQVHTQAGVTLKDGAYSIPVTVSVPLYTPLEWAVEAHTADYQKVELTGRRIVTEKDKADGRATLETALALL